MEDSPCPNCGYRRQRYLMSIDPDAPGIFGLLRGEGAPSLRAVAWIGTILFCALVLAFVMHYG